MPKSIRLLWAMFSVGVALGMLSKTPPVVSRHGLILYN